MKKEFMFCLSLALGCGGSTVGGDASREAVITPHPMIPKNIDISLGLDASPRPDTLSTSDTPSTETPPLCTPETCGDHVSYSTDYIGGEVGLKQLYVDSDESGTIGHYVREVCYSFTDVGGTAFARPGGLGAKPDKSSSPSTYIMFSAVTDDYNMGIPQSLGKTGFTMRLNGTSYYVNSPWGSTTECADSLFCCKTGIGWCFDINGDGLYGPNVAIYNPMMVGQVLSNGTAIPNTVQAQELVTVPAGTFNSFMLINLTNLSYDADASPYSDAIEARSWFVPYVGMVKFQVIHYEGGRASSTVVKELVSITRQPIGADGVAADCENATSPW